jgi:hypothetical protein
MSMRDFVDFAKKTLVLITVVGYALYAIAMLAYAFNFEPAVALFSRSQPFFMFALPISGILAFAVVALLETLSPATKDESGKVEFKAFGLTFSGPAGPVTLWIAVYLTIVASAHLVK